jgi:hypothetical protein
VEPRSTHSANTNSSTTPTGRTKASPTPDHADEEWRAAFAELTGYDKETGRGFPMYPNFVPCGVEDADPRGLQALIHPSTGGKQMKMYLMSEGQDPAKAINMIAEILISSMLASGASMAEGGSGIILPDKRDVPAGINVHSADDDFV